MALPDPNLPQVVDTERTVDLTRLLQIRGPLGVLNVLDTIVPVVNMGDVVTRTVRVEQPVFSSSTVFSAGLLVAAPLNTVHADTSALAEGDYDVIILGHANSSISFNWAFEHRDAANAANLATWFGATFENDTGGAPLPVQRFAYSFAPNERLRVLNLTAVPAGQHSHAAIFAVRRP